MSENNTLNLRKVNKDDIELLYEWVNDPAVRNNSFNTGKIALSYAQENSVGQKILMQYIRKQVKSVSMKGKKVVFDTETTGLDVQKEHIIQLSLVKFDTADWHVIDTRDWYILPEGEFTTPKASISKASSSTWNKS